MEDTDVIEKLKAGDRSAFKRLYENYNSKVYNTCLSYLQNKEEAEEVTQDVFVELFHSAIRFKGDSALGTWIYRITVNKCLDAIRYRKRKKRSGFFISLFKKESTALQIDQPHFDHPGVLLENKEKAQLLFQVISRLPEQQKTAFILSHVEDLTQKEIAAVMKTSEKAVESLIQRAKANLRNELEIVNPSRRK